MKRDGGHLEPKQVDPRYYADGADLGAGHRATQP